MGANGGYVFPEPYRKLGFKVGPPSCGDRCTYTPLQFEVTEVWGTSPKVAVGERYVVEGDYRLAGNEACEVSLAVFESAFGATAYLAPGTGRFSTSTEILRLIDDPPNAIGVVVGPQPGNIVAWITILE